MESGTWHLVRHTVQDDKSRLRFNDYPYGILASETHLVLHALDLMGMHKEAWTGWTSGSVFPSKTRSRWAFSRTGSVASRMPRARRARGKHGRHLHAMGPGAIMFALVEHFRLSGDGEWLKAKRAADESQRRVDFAPEAAPGPRIVPGGDRLWCKGLQPAHQVTPDSGGQLMQFYESEAYYWLVVRRFARILAQIDPAEGARLAAEAESYRKDLKAAVERSIAMSPVVLTRRDHRLFIPLPATFAASRPGHGVGGGRAAARTSADCTGTRSSRRSRW